ncbi:MAG TPA: YciI family protein [Acidimicrobiia bacterium]|nr:YciI family protein [Acidimicrobiia bacterium]
MRYMMLICVEEKWLDSLTDDEGAAMLAKYGEFTTEMGARGVLQGGERLRPTTTATTVRVRDGEVLTSDGPFTETKEQVGGYFVVDAADLDAAIEIASKIPGAAHGAIEVRPIWEM